MFNNIAIYCCSSCSWPKIRFISANKNLIVITNCSMHINGPQKTKSTCRTIAVEGRRGLRSFPPASNALHPLDQITQGSRASRRSLSFQTLLSANQPRLHVDGCAYKLHDRAACQSKKTGEPPCHPFDARNTLPCSITS